MCLSLQDLAQRTQMPEKGKSFNSFLGSHLSKYVFTHQASLFVPPAPGGNSQSVFEVLGHIVVRHDVVQHSADNQTGKDSLCQNCQFQPDVKKA